VEMRAQVEIEEGPTVRCRIPPELAIHPGDQCVVKVDGVLEFGKIAGLDKAVGELAPSEKQPTVLRRATLQDQAKASESALMSRMAKATCAEVAKKHDMTIRLVRVRYSFERQVLMILFAAEERIDCREYAKDLSAETRARIDIRQIGVRDEAAIKGGMGPCGRTMCCCSWLRDFASINVRMAKAQRLSLNPSTISGMCGRLKCCLRYEYDCYRQMGKTVPREGSMVECPHGSGRVVDRDILRQRVRVRMEEGPVEVFDVDDVSMKGAQRHAAAAEHSDTERSEIDDEDTPS